MELTTTVNEACRTLVSTVQGIKDFYISFDHARDEVELLWMDEVFRVPVDEVAHAIDTLTYLEARRLKNDYD